MPDLPRRLRCVAGQRPSASLSAVTEPRRFFLRTFGCQMNEHDSERIAGLLQADGLVETASVEDADVVVLNTCCIRENADNKLYGTLGPPQVGEGPHAGDADHGRRVPGPEGPRRRHRAGPLRRRGARHPQRAPRRRPAPRGSGRRPLDRRDPRGDRRRGPRRLPLGPAGAPGGAVGRVGHDPDRLRQQLRLLHRPRRAGQGDQPPVRRHRRRGAPRRRPTASPRSRCSART